MWVSNPLLPGIVKTIPDEAFYGGWSTFGWVEAAAPVPGDPGYAVDAGWPVSKTEVNTVVAGLVGPAVASAIGTELPPAIGEAIDTFREEANSTYLTQAEADTDLAPASTTVALAAVAVDPLGLGFVATVGALDPGGAAIWPTANDARYVRVISGGTISKIGLYVEASSGNVSVAAYRKAGNGRAALPGARLATSGAVACPAVGYQEITLGASVDVEMGDYLALSCDNTTASFTGTAVSLGMRAIFAPFAYAANAGHPLAAPAPAVGGSTSKTPILVGVP
jgi:hypothetical protein